MKNYQITLTIVAFAFAIITAFASTNNSMVDDPVTSGISSHASSMCATILSIDGGFTCNTGLSAQQPICKIEGLEAFRYDSEGCLSENLLRRVP